MMKLRNKHTFTQMEWELNSLKGVVMELTEERPSTEINSGQNHRTFQSLVTELRIHLNELEEDFEQPTGQEENED